jgi:hypothetical protein
MRSINFYKVGTKHYYYFLFFFFLFRYFFIVGFFFSSSFFCTLFSTIYFKNSNFSNNFILPGKRAWRNW